MAGWWSCGRCAAIMTVEQDLRRCEWKVLRYAGDPVANAVAIKPPLAAVPGACAPPRER